MRIWGKFVTVKFVYNYSILWYIIMGQNIIYPFTMRAVEISAFLKGLRKRSREIFSMG